MTDKSAAPVWEGMQTASGQTRAKISYLAMVGPNTDANARDYVNTLAQRHCDLVFAAGNTQVKAVAAQAGTWASTRFVIVGEGQAMNNVTVLNPVPPSAVPHQVEAAVEQAVSSPGHK